MMFHISKIEYMNVSFLKLHYIIPSKRAVKINHELPWLSICNFGLIQVETTSERDNSQLIFTTKVNYTTDKFQRIDNEPKCFRLTAVDGQQFLLGFLEAPFPAITQTEKRSSKTTDTSNVTVTINWKSIYPLLTIL